MFNNEFDQSLSLSVSQTCGLYVGARAADSTAHQLDCSKLDMIHVN